MSNIPARRTDIELKSCRTSKVTVYRDRAEVVCESEVTLSAGEQEVVFLNYPNGTSKDSIRVSGVTSATSGPVPQILEVVCGEVEVLEDHEPLQLPDPVDEAVKGSLEQEEQRLQDAITEQKGNLRVTETEEVWLRDYSKTLLSATTNQNLSSVQDLFSSQSVNNVTNFLSFYRREVTRLDTAKHAANRAIVQLQTQLNVVKEKLGELELQRRKYEEAVKKAEEMLKIPKKKVKKNGIRVALSSTRDCKMTLAVSLTVSGCSWAASYDVRVSSTTNEVELVYYGMVKQNTGMDWSDSTLALSTASPLTGSQDPPTLPPSTVSIYRYQPPVYQPSFRNYTENLEDLIQCDVKCESESIRSLNESKSARRSSARIAPPPPPVPVAVMTAVSQVSMTSATFTIPRLCSVPSDNAPHKVTIAILNQLQSTFSHVAVPKLTKDAFLRAKVVNSSDFVFLPGDLSIFIDNNFACSSKMALISPQESFEVSLGIDPSVKIDYRPVKVFNETAGLLRKSNVRTYRQVVVLKNTKKVPLELSLKDNVPYSSEEKIKVRISDPTVSFPEPSSTTPSKLENLSYRISPSLTSSFAAGASTGLVPEAIGATGYLEVNHEHLLEWKLQVEAGAEVEIPFTYVVEWPLKENLSFS